MSHRDVPDYDMPENLIPFPHRGPSLSGEVVDQLLAEDAVSTDASADVTPLADLIAALRAPGQPSELSGESAAVSAFSLAMSAGAQHETRRRKVLGPLLGAKIALAAVIGSLAMGGVAAAAYSGSLPEGIQDFAHDTIGAPHSQGQVAQEADDQGEDDASEPADEPTDAENSASESPDGTKSTPVGPDATGPAAFGLCTAFAHSKSHEGANQHSVAYRSLLSAATDAGQTVEEYCATIPHPGSQPSATATPSGGAEPTGVPSVRASAKHSSHHTGKPASHPTGAPSTAAHS
jgi:hypothetical protein